MMRMDIVITLIEKIMFLREIDVPMEFIKMIIERKIKLLLLVLEQTLGII